MLQQLRTFNADALQLEDLVELSTFARAFEAELILVGVEAPRWLEDRVRELRREIRFRIEDRLEKRIVEGRARLEALKPEAEKRLDLAKELEQMQAKLQTIREGK